MKTLNQFNILILLSLCFIFSRIYAQPTPPVFAIQGEIFPEKALEDPLPFAPGLETKSSNFKTHFAFPLMNTDRQKLIGKVSFQQLGFKYRNSERLAYAPEKLRELALQLAFISGLGNDWRLNIFATPNLASDFENIGSNHINVNAGVLFSPRSTKNSGYAFGAIYNNDFGEPRLLPAVRYWKKNKQLRIDLFLPRSAEIILLLGQRIEAGLAATVSGNHYRIGEDVRFPNDQSTMDGRIKYSALTAGPRLGIGVSDNLFLTLESSMALSRQFELFDSNDNNVTTLDLEKGFLLRTGLQLRN